MVCLRFPHLTFFFPVSMDARELGDGKTKPGYHSCVVLYASQTGNAKAIAENISEQCTEKDLSHSIYCISESDKKFSLDKTSCLVIVASTTGDGDPPDTARKIWRLLNKKNLSIDTYGHLSYTVLGLGDTNYTNFCNFGKNLDQKLQSLGAKRFYPCGWADDGTGLEIVIEPWIEGLFPVLMEHMKTYGENKITSSDSTCIHLNSALTEKERINNFSEDCSEKTDIMEKEEGVDQSEISKLKFDKDLWEIASKFGLHILSREELQNISVRACAFSVDTKLSVPVLPPSFLNVRFRENLEEKNDSNFTLPLISAATSIFDMNLVSLKTLTRHDAVKTTLEATLESQNVGELVNYLPGDSFGILVKNPIAEVELLLALLGISHVADIMYELTVEKVTKKRNASIPNFVPPVSTLRYVFENCVDFRCVPKKPLLRTLVEHTEDPIEKWRLKELVSKEGSSEYNKYVRESNLTLLDLLIIFQTCKPPVATLLEHLPQLQPRSYSIISSPLLDPKKIQFAFNIIEIHQSEAVTFSRRGLCTGWLASYTQSSQIESLDSSLRNLSLANSKGDDIFKIYLRNNQNFHLPKENSTPIVMVGPGTGVAPFVGFLRHRQMLMKNEGKDKFGKSWLFYGCRHRDRDYLYREELEKFQNEEVLSHLLVSFSREEDSTDSKYVQDNIRSCGSSLTSLIVDERAVVYVCGDAQNMAKDVFESFVSVLEKCKNLSTVEARKYIAQMQIEKRYLQDVWA